MYEALFDEIYRSQVVEKVTNSIQPYVRDYREDFIQEMYLTIFELPPERLERLYKSGQLYFYIVKVIRNQGVYMKSPFHRKYSQPNIQTVEYIENLQVADE